jgi:hypothetical protein
MTVHWEIENRQYMLLRVFRRCKQAKREADKIERWYASQGIPITIRLERDNGCLQDLRATSKSEGALHVSLHARVQPRAQRQRTRQATHANAWRNGSRKEDRD